MTPETSLVPHGELERFTDGWALPPGWRVDYVAWSAPYGGGHLTGRPDRLEVDVVHELGHRARLMLGPQSRHPREWLNPLLTAAAAAIYLVDLRIDGTTW